MEENPKEEVLIARDNETGQARSSVRTPTVPQKWPM